MGIRLILECFVNDDSSSDIENHKFDRNLTPSNTILRAEIDFFAKKLS